MENYPDPMLETAKHLNVVNVNRRVAEIGSTKKYGMPMNSGKYRDLFKLFSFKKKKKCRILQGEVLSISLMFLS